MTLTEPAVLVHAPLRDLTSISLPWSHHGSCGSHTHRQLAPNVRNEPPLRKAQITCKNWIWGDGK
jgi:hypothetical protein